MTFVWFCFVAFAITQIIVYGSIFDSIRPSQGKLGELFRCPMCVGFWVGMFLWLIKDFTKLFSFDNSIVTGFLCACVASGSSYILNVLFSDEGLKMEKLVHVKRKKNDKT